MTELRGVVDVTQGLRDKFTVVKQLSTNKELWTVENAEVIASVMGYVPDEAFCLVLRQFISEIVGPARILHHIIPVAVGYFLRASETVALQKRQ